METSRATNRPEHWCPSWLLATAAQLPDTIQSAASINAALHRPSGWLEQHAGIAQRRVWAEQDPLAAAAAAGQACLERSGIAGPDVGALLVTSEAPPLLTGLAAALHDRLHLARSSLALEVGGACTGFLMALRVAQALLHQLRIILVIAVEAHSRYLRLQPGWVGEDAALFGDGAAASLLGREPRGPEALPLSPVHLEVAGNDAALLQLFPVGSGVELHMKRFPVAHRAVEVMAQSVNVLAEQHQLDLAQVPAIVAHGGNGRLPGLLARKLGVPQERVWSETPQLGNLGSASLPVAWALHQPRPVGPVLWTAVGAGLSWGAALLGQHLPSSPS